MRLLYTNLFDSATLTGSSEVATLPRTNLQNKILGKVWRSTGITSQYVSADLLSAQSINCIAFLNHNFTSAATFRLRGSNISDFSTTLYDQAFDVWVSPISPTSPLNVTPLVINFLEPTYLVDQNGNYFVDENGNRIQTSSPTTLRYWRVDFTDAGNTDGYFQIGRMWLGQYFEPVKNINWPWEISWFDPSITTESLGGQPYTDIQDRRRLINFSITRLSKAEKLTLLDIQNTVGFRNDVIISLIPDKTNTEWYYSTFYGRFSGTFPISNYTGNWQSIQIEGFKETR